MTHNLRKLRRALAELLTSHAQHIHSASEVDDHPPRIRLQDWRVIEQVRVDGTDYVLLRHVPDGKRGFESLTTRERDAVRLASTGASNKEIAHEMNIRSSTVGVLLWRACQKLRLASRDDLIRTFLAIGRRPKALL